MIVWSHLVWISENVTFEMKHNSIAEMLNIYHPDEALIFSVRQTKNAV